MENLEVKNITTTNGSGSQISNDGANKIQKMKEGNYDRQNAFWAYHFIQRICYCSDTDFPQLR
jgi:hypothetical protein